MPFFSRTMLGLLLVTLGFAAIVTAAVQLFTEFLGPGLLAVYVLGGAAFVLILVGAVFALRGGESE